MNYLWIPWRSSQGLRDTHIPQNVNILDLKAEGLSGHGSKGLKEPHMYFKVELYPSEHGSTIEPEVALLTKAVTVP